MTLTDAGPLVALIDRGEADHQRCVAALRSLSAPLLTTWPALTEAMCLLGDAGGWTPQDALWRLVARRDLVLAELDETLVDRTRSLMEKYHDLPMDLTDATLVAVAEARKLKRVFTLDGDFQVYRLKDRTAFKVIP